MCPIEFLIYTILYVILVLGIIIAILKDTVFLNSGFRYKSLLLLPCFFMSSCIWEYNTIKDENRNDAPIQALMDYHYGVKNQDTNRFKKAIYNYRQEHINVAMLILQDESSCDIIWHHDSFLGKDSVWVYYREVNTAWGNMLHRKLFLRYQGRWARKIGYD